MFVQDLGWDLVVGHPPCTYLSNASGQWLNGDQLRWQQMRQNAAVFRRIRDACAPFVAVENSKMNPHARQLIGGTFPTQYVHPWQHGHGHTKPTGLFLRNLPPLVPTNIVHERDHALARLAPGAGRGPGSARGAAGAG